MAAKRASKRKPNAQAARKAAAIASLPGVVVRGRIGPRYAEILSRDALAFLAELHRRFDGKRRDLLAARSERQKRFDAGELPDFPPETRHIRDNDSWRVAPIPADLTDRRVEITGPVDRKMIVNALNSGATHYMADFEDANSPTWANNIEGQINLKDRWQGQIDFTDPHTKKRYAIGPKPAVLIVRPRGWHLSEAHLTVDGVPISGALFDFGLFFFHNAKAQLAQGSGPYFYLPKLESRHEARLWNEVFLFAQDTLGIPKGSIRATVLIETLPAAFEMDEILWEMRDHIVGMNAGRWDYIFSFIKTFAKNSNYVLPDRSQVVMGEGFLGGYASLLVRTCHRRGAFAMGGMAAQIPIKNDSQANAAAFAKVRADKEREVRDGLRWHLGGASRFGAGGQGSVRPPDAATEPNRSCPPTCARAARRPVEDSQRDQDRSGRAPQYPGRRTIYRCLAARARRGADLQSHGRRGDRRNLPRANLAMDQIRRRARGRRESNRRVFRARAQARDASGQARGRGGKLRAWALPGSDQVVSRTVA